MKRVITFAYIPHAFIESFETAMQMIRAVVARKLVFNAVEGEASKRNAVGVTPDQGAEITWTPNVFVERFKPEHDLAEVAIAIRCLQRRDRATVVRNRNFKPVTVAECVSKSVFHPLDPRLKTRFASSSVSIEPTSYQMPGAFHT